MSIFTELKQLATVDIFKEANNAARFVGRPFYFDYARVKLLVNDAWKNKVGGIPASAFLVAVYDNPETYPEIILLRVLGPTTLPTDSDVIAAMVDYYKESSSTEAAAGKLDSYTRYEFQFSGLECRVLGSFYRGPAGQTLFGADVDNFYSPNNYSVYKPDSKVLEYLVNFREGVGIPGGQGDARIGQVRYSASRYHQTIGVVPVYISAIDFLGKRTALFGMTRTGKSNTVKKIIEATAKLTTSDTISDGVPAESIGQIIFDVNGEYANDNQQDQGTAIYQLFHDVVRYSILAKPGFKVMKLNFYDDVTDGFGLIQAGLADDTAIYTKAFLNVSWEQLEAGDKSAETRFQRRVACYQGILFAAGFVPPTNFTIAFQGNQTLNSWSGVTPDGGVTPQQAIAWFSAIWQRLETDQFFQTYRVQHGHEWADDDLKNLMRFLTRCPKPGAAPSEAGFRKLIPFRELHTPTIQATFLTDIVDQLRHGTVVIVDLSQGDPAIQRTYSDRVCRAIFAEAMDRFIHNQVANVVQMYFEEAHNLFPRKEEKDLTNIYNRIAKEGAKLNIGLIYATQEVSSISSNVLKNTQNWFVSHLNNQDELHEVAKYYDFEDFVESLRRATDKGFIRMKAYSNPFITPVQIDRFSAINVTDGI